MHRRDFLRYMISAPIAAATFVYGNPFRSILGLAQESSAKVLVVIFQRGGCDGLNTIIPYGDGEYYNLRPDISIAPPGTAEGALDLDDFLNKQDGLFGMHPALSPLYDIYQHGTVAILPAVHYDNASTSHFVGQDNIESGASVRLPDGWLNRYLATTQKNTSLRAAGFGSTTPHSLQGKTPVSTFSDLNEFELSDNDLMSKLESIYSQTGSSPESYRSMLLEKGGVMLDNLKTLAQVDPEAYSPGNGAVYPSSLFGTQLRQTAQLIKEGVGLEVSTVNIGGYDNHANQGGATGSQASRHTDFAAGIAALYTDLGPSGMNDVLILTMSEFGRTAKNNASLGTDHGNASTWFVIGNNVTGGIYGDWPGLQEGNLYRQRYLAHNIDFRNVMGEVVDRHLQSAGSLSDVLPNHDYQPTGFLPAAI